MRPKINWCMRPKLFPQCMLRSRACRHLASLSLNPCMTSSAHDVTRTDRGPFRHSYVSEALLHSLNFAFNSLTKFQAPVLGCWSQCFQWKMHRQLSGCIGLGYTTNDSLGGYNYIFELISNIHLIAAIFFSQ
jgi:hypothetical protein